MLLVYVPASPYSCLFVYPPMSCCKCNRSGCCRNCSCLKSGRTCQGCLPQRLSVTAPMATSRHRNRRLLTPTSHPTSIHRSTVQICSPRHLLNWQSLQRPDVTTLQPHPYIPLQPYSSLTLRGVPVVKKRSARESTPPTRR